MKTSVTYIFFTYSQKEFMLESVSSALNQSYPNLEIIFSDDYSEDGTFEEMNRIVSAYQGSHKVILNKNEKNLGMPEHFNKVVAMASGEFIVVGAGDDISLPNRVDELVKEWQKTGVSAIFSNSMVIDEKGNKQCLLFPSPPKFAKDIEDFKKGMPCWANGASLAFEKSVFMKYGRVPTFQEDGAMAFRALLTNGLGYVNKPLLQYRKHSEGVSSGLSAKNRLKFQLNEYPMRKGWYQDALFTHATDSSLFTYLNRQIAKSKLKKNIFTLPLVGLMYNHALIVMKKLGLR
ncbi:MAG: glycosyltransferase [Zetaproteobacteria bacterium]|nr:glycosyltransferase [Zetaproteobacteria bacterium]